MTGMEKTLREKIALIVFALLVVVTGIVLISYFSTGRSWTIAATFVDDTVGEMDGYSVILFNGVLDAQDETSDDFARADSSDSPDVSAGAGENQGESAALSASTSSDARGSEDQGADTTPSFVSNDASIEAYLETQDGLIKDESVLHAEQAAGSTSNTDAVSENLLAPERSIGLRILSMYPRALNGVFEGVFVSDVSDLYERKGAGVVTLNLSDAAHYSSPLVLTGGSKKVGVFSATSYQSKATLESIAQDFSEKGTNVTVCITPRLALISDYEAIDIVILTTPIEEQSELYRSRVGGDTFVVEAPEKGEVGMVILSSNDIPSSRIIEVF